MAAGMAAAAIAVLSACGGDDGSGSRALGGRTPTSKFCRDELDRLRLFADGRLSRDEVGSMARLASRFDAYKRLFRRFGDQPMNTVSGNLATGLRRLIPAVGGRGSAGRAFDQIARAEQALPADFCFTDARREWVGSRNGWFEVRLPVSWRAYVGPWGMAGRGRVGEALRAGLQVAPGTSLVVEGDRWEHPGVWIGVSRTLAGSLRIKRVRRAVALDRLRRQLEGRKLAGGCKLVTTVPYADRGSQIFGFLRRWDSCGPHAAAVVELMALGRPDEANAAFIDLVLTARRPGQLAGMGAILDSFHLTNYTAG